MTLGERLKRLREEKGWTQRELARISGVDNAWIWRLENGERMFPSIPAAMKLAKAFGVTLDYLAGMYDDNKQKSAAPGLVLV